jgi:hypothetical protein
VCRLVTPFEKQKNVNKVSKQQIDFSTQMIGNISTQLTSHFKSLPSIHLKHQIIYHNNFLRSSHFSSLLQRNQTPQLLQIVTPKYCDKISFISLRFFASGSLQKK